MESTVLHSGSAEHLSSHASSSSSPVAMGFDTPFVPPDPPAPGHGLFYERFIHKQHHENGGSQFVSLTDLNATFRASDPCFESNIPCFSPRLSDYAPDDFDHDFSPLLGSLPDEFVSYQFDAEVYGDPFAYTRFSSDFASSAMTASFPQQQPPSDDPRNIELQQDMPVMSDEFTGLPSLPLLGDPSGVDSLVNTSELYVPFEVECSGNCGSMDISTALFPLHYDPFCFDDQTEADTSLIGPPSVQSFPQAPAAAGQADLPFSTDRVGTSPSVPRLKTRCLRACNVRPIPSTEQNDLPSNTLPLGSVASHDLQTCSMPMCNSAVSQSAPTRVSSARTEGHVDLLVESAIEKFNEETPALGSLRALEEEREAHVGLSAAGCSQDVEGASVGVPLPDQRYRMPLDPRRNHGRLDNRRRPDPLGRPSAYGTEEPQLPETCKGQRISEILRGKEKRTRKSQSLIEPTGTSMKDALLPFRKKRARKSVERKLNEAILIFNNMESDWESGDGEETITEETTTARFPTDTTTEPGSCSTSGLALRSMTNCTQHSVDYDEGSHYFSEHDGAKEATIQSQVTASPAAVLQFPISGKGDVFIGELPFYSPSTFGVLDESAFEWSEHATSDLSQGEKQCKCGCTPHLNVKVVTGVDDNDNQNHGQWSSEQGRSFYTSNPITEVHLLSDSDQEDSTMEQTIEEFDTKIIEDSMDYFSVSDTAAAKLDTEANAIEVEAEGMRRTYACSEAMLEAQLQPETKSEERAYRRSVESEEEHITSGCAAAVLVTVAVGTEGEAEQLSQSDCDSPSTPDAISETAIADKSPREREGRCDMYSRLAMVPYNDPTAELTYATGADDRSDGFLEGPCSNDKSFGSASDFEEFEEPAINFNVENDQDGEYSEAFTSPPIPADSRMEIEIPTDRKGKVEARALIGRNAGIAFGRRQKYGTCFVRHDDQVPSQGIQRMQTPSSLHSASQLTERSASLSTVHAKGKRKTSTSNMAKCHVEGKSTLRRTRAQKAKAHDTSPQKAKVSAHDPSPMKLAVRAMRLLKSKARVRAQGGENYVIHPYSGVDPSSSNKCRSMVQRGMVVHHHKQAPENKETTSEDLGGNESLNAYQQKRMKLLKDFIESGYGVGVQPSDSANAGNGDTENSDIDDELRKGTIVVHSDRNRLGTANEAQNAVLYQRNQGLSTETEAGIPGSSSHRYPLAGIYLHRPAPVKIHTTRSQSRAHGAVCSQRNNSKQK